MMGSIGQFFKNQMAPAEDATVSEDKIRIATCALLLEAAHADDEFSAEEQQKIVALLQKRFRLDDAATKELLELAEQERQASTDMYQFARLINDNYSHGRILAVVELLWEVVFSDGVLEAHEDALMHKLGTLLGLRHEEVIALKMKAKRNSDS